MARARQLLHTSRIAKNAIPSFVDFKFMLSSQHTSSRVVTVILLCGLPASGKSSLARSLQHALQQRCHEHSTFAPTATAATPGHNHPTESNCNIIKRNHYHHDKDMNSSNNNHTSEEQPVCQVVHLEYDSLEDSISLLDEHDDSGQRRRRQQAWNEARQMAMQQLETLLSSTNDNDTYNCNNHNNIHPQHLIILLDDNYYLRGMRKQIHRKVLAAKTNHPQQYNSFPAIIRFGILFLNTPLSICLERNQKRMSSSEAHRHVPEHVLYKMNQHFEPPPKAIWESCTLQVNITDDPNTTTPSLEHIVEFVLSCDEIVDTTAMDATFQEQQKLDRQHTQQNKVHNWDNVLRTWVGQVAKYEKRLAQHANRARKDVLMRLGKDSDCCVKTVMEEFVESLVAGSAEGGKRESLQSVLIELLLESQSS